MSYTDLPKGWALARLAEVAKWGSGGTPPRNSPHFYDGSIPWIKTGELGPKYIRSAEEHITEEAILKSSAKVFPSGSVGIAMYGATIGKLSIWAVDASTNQACAVAQTHEGVLSNEFLYYFLLSEKNSLIESGKGGAQPNISQGILKNWPIRLPPFNEQLRIVAEIEKQFTRLDAAVEALKRVKANLKRYRASVLKAACEGRLVPTKTELARAEGRDYEPADQLLARILQERRARWEADQLARMQSAGKPPKDSKWKSKYREPAAPDTTKLPDLPVGWVWAVVEQLGADEPNAITDGPFGSNLKTSHYTLAGPRVIRLQNIGDGVFLDEKAHISAEHFGRLKKYRIEAGDLVIAALGQRPPRACMIPISVGPAIVKADCIRFKAHPNLVTNYLLIALTAEPTKIRTTSIVHGVGRPRLNLTEIKAIVLPLPPSAEQERIAAEVDRRLSVIEGIEVEVEHSLRRAERLRQAILKRAFEGKLVPQDPADEPASVLLERIRAERQQRERPREKKTRTAVQPSILAEEVAP